MKRKNIFGWIALGLLIAGGAAFFHDWPFSWKEDVQLHSGEVIVIQRSATLSANYIAGGGGGSIVRNMTIEFIKPSLAPAELPASATLPSAATVASYPTTAWHSRFVPAIIDRDPDNQEWFIIGTFFHCDSWYEIGRPKLPYTEFRYRNGRWQRQPLSEKFIGRPTNLHIADRNLADPHLSFDLKNYALSRPGIGAEYLHIANEWHSGC